MSRRIAVGAVAAAIASNACTDLGTELAETAATPFFSTSSQAPAELIPNSKKYRDAGAKPATGRAGSATLTTRALLGKDRRTVVEATTGALDGGTTLGEISKIQAKLTGPGGTRTLNYSAGNGTGYWSTSYDGLGRNDQVQVQANIRGIDGNRTEVITLDNVIKLRPDLEVSQLTAPREVGVNSLVHISAKVAEINMDVGARANCVLEVDGEPVADARGIWVDADDAVTCAFVTTFASLGPKQLSVRAADVLPGDWDIANNTVSGAINVVRPATRLRWDMSLYGVDRIYDVRYSDPRVTTGRTGSVSERNLSVYADGASDDDLRSEDLTFTGTLVSDGIAIGAASARSRSWSIWWDDYLCSDGFDASRNMSFAFCQNRSGAVAMSASQYSTRAVYYDIESYNSYEGHPDRYWYVDQSSGFGAWPLRSHVALELKATSSSGKAVMADAKVGVWLWYDRQFFPCRDSDYYSCSGGEYWTVYSGWDTGS